MAKKKSAKSAGSARKKKTAKKSTGKSASKKKTSSKKKSPYTKASKFVAEEMHEYKHGGGKKKARPIKSRKQAIAIGLSKAREKGIRVPSKRKSR